MSQTELPPGQQLAQPGKWPTVGERLPAPLPEVFTVAVGGEVDAPRTFDLAELAALPQIEQTIDIHCVTRWSKLGVAFSGVPLARLLELAKVRSRARFVLLTAYSDRAHSTSLALDDAIRLETLVALAVDGAPLPTEHGGPVRTITPGRYFYKSLKWLRRIDLLVDDRLGFWESSAGYHNHADPWHQERFIAPGWTMQKMRSVLASRDLTGCDAHGLRAAGMDLRGLSAGGAVLRDADFRRCDLRQADFTGANLSGAHFDDADLRASRLSGADVEGADFMGADLRGTDFSGASLLGASFFDERAGEDPSSLRPIHAAILDGTTRIDAPAIDQLTPRQQRLVAAALAGAEGTSPDKGVA